MAARRARRLVGFAAPQGATAHKARRTAAAAAALLQKLAAFVSGEQNLGGKRAVRRGCSNAAHGNACSKEGTESHMESHEEAAAREASAEAAATTAAS